MQGTILVSLNILAALKCEATAVEHFSSRPLSRGLFLTSDVSAMHVEEETS